MLGLGGKLMVLYRSDRLKVVGLAFLLGFAIVGLAMFTALALGLEPLHLCVIVLVYTLVAGRLTSRLGAGRIEPSPPPLPSEEDIRAMLRVRGFGKLLKKRGRRRTA